MYTILCSMNVILKDSHDSVLLIINLSYNNTYLNCMRKINTLMYIFTILHQIHYYL